MTSISSRLMLLGSVSALGGACLCTSMLFDLRAVMGSLGSPPAAAASGNPAQLPIGLDPELVLCQTPVGRQFSNATLRLVQTEVPRAQIQAATPAPAFADTDPP